MTERDMDKLRRLHGERSRRYKGIVTDTRHWAFAEVTENHPLGGGMLEGRSSIKLGRTDNGKCGWITYGPADLAVGSTVELFEFRIYNKWHVDFRVLPAEEGTGLTTPSDSA